MNIADPTILPLALRDVSFAIGGKRLIKDVTCAFPPGLCTVVVGPKDAEGLPAPSRAEGPAPSRGEGTAAGASARTAALIWLMCSGVVPQHPPTTRTLCRMKRRA